MKELPLQNILFLLGVGGMIVGSLAALREKNINRMVALSSAAQIGYIFMSLGMGLEAAYAAAVFHMLGHAVTKSLLFLTVPRLVDVSDGSMAFSDLKGSALRHPAAGLMFTAASFSMVGIPVFVGFSSKLFITLAASKAEQKAIFYIAIASLVISTVLNALYFIRTVIGIFSRPEGDGVKIEAAKAEPAYLVSSLGLMAANVFMGVSPMVVYALIERGLLQL